MSIQPILSYLKNHFKDSVKGLKEIKYLEVGARYGESTKMVIQSLNVKSVDIIDPYEDYEEYSQDGFNSILKENKDYIFNSVKESLSRYHPCITFHRGFSTDKDIIDSIPDGSLDLIFIDGNHTFKYVLNDLENYYPKLKERGIMCGDDFFMRTYKNDVLKSGAGYDEPMVYEAVLEFCKKHNKTYTEFGVHRSYGKVFMINQ